MVADRWLAGALAGGSAGRCVWLATALAPPLQVFGGWGASWVLQRGVLSRRVRGVPGRSAGVGVAAIAAAMAASMGLVAWGRRWDIDTALNHRRLRIEQPTGRDRRQAQSQLFETARSYGDGIPCVGSGMLGRFRPCRKSSSALLLYADCGPRDDWTCESRTSPTVEARCH